MTHADWKEQGLSQAHAVLERVMGSRYLLFAIVVHLGLLALLGSLVVIRNQVALPRFQAVPTFLTDPAHPILPPPANQPPRDEPSNHSELAPAGPIMPSDSTKALREIITTGQAPGKLHSFGQTDPLGHFQKPAGSAGWNSEARPFGRVDIARLTRVRAFQAPWIDRKRWDGTGIPPATFTCYLARYADGDWDCNPTALENMLIQVVRWSKDRIKASVQPGAISVGSDEIFQTKPPFIFLTGHKDFHFTDQEVANLREYLLAGGTLWADNSLPGRHSRFDEAFRREMKRVMSDRDFEQVPGSHPIYSSFFHLKETPRGMNFYKEPIEHIKVLDESVVIYTQNAYSDLWETALDEQNKIDTELYLDEDTGQCYHKSGPHWGNWMTGFLYRNVNEESIVEANRLALNIIVHLLTQYEEKFRMIGKL